MLVFLTHRRLKPDATFEQFREAWDPGEMPEGVREVAYHARSLENPDEIISFGMAPDIGPEDLPELMAKFDPELLAERERRMAEVVEWTGVDQTFEVVDELRWGM